MSADFWAGYISGATGILLGNPLDLIKTRVQADPGVVALGNSAATPTQATLRSHFDRAGTLVRGAAAPIVGYGALNALLFVSYNRTLSLLTSQPYPYPSDSDLPLPSLWKIWMAGATAGLATFVVSAPTELIKCRAQVSNSQRISSWSIARDTWRREGIRGLYFGGGVTSIRDAVGYGFYFWAYEWSKASLSSPDDSQRDAALKVLLCGGMAGVITWASIFPLDVIKTRMQTQSAYAISTPSSPSHGSASSPLLASKVSGRLSSFAIAQQAYRTEGLPVFFRGLGICSIRAFIVNAVQWAVYEWMMQIFKTESPAEIHQLITKSDTPPR